VSVQNMLQCKYVTMHCYHRSKICYNVAPPLVQNMLQCSCGWAKNTNESWTCSNST